MKGNARAALALLLRLAVGGLLVVAGALKLTDPAQFALEIANYQLLPQTAPLVSVVLPAIEIVTGAALVFLPRPWRRAAGSLSVVLLTVFLVAVGSAYFRGVNIDCGCFGGEASPIDHWTLVRNVVLIGAAVGILFLERPRAGQVRA